MGNSKSESSGDIDEFLKNIERLTNELPGMINLHYGLLDTLVSQGLLTHQQLIAIKAKQTHHSQVRQLMIVIIITIINAFDNAPNVDVRTANRGSGQSSKLQVNSLLKSTEGRLELTCTLW